MKAALITYSSLQPYIPIWRPLKNHSTLWLFFILLFFSSTPNAMQKTKIDNPHKQQHHSNLSMLIDALEDSEFEASYTTSYHDINVSVQKGDSIWSILRSQGIDHKTTSDIVAQINNMHSPLKLSIGSIIQMRLYENPNRTMCPVSILWPVSNSWFIVVDGECKTGKFSAKKVNRILRRQVYRASSYIDGNLSNTFRKMGLSDNLMHKLTEIFVNRINFAKDINNDSSFELLFECYLDEQNRYVRDGDILFATIKTNKKMIMDYLFTDNDGCIGYYDNNGVATKQKSFVLPIKNYRITSRFGMRMHPLHGRKSMHKGVDFAAPTGTAVHSTKSGQVTFMGQNKSYGKFIKIKHNNAYTTLYAHLNSWPKNLKVGDWVEQGQVIAYVGRTGRVTGPHLHYEVLRNNINIDPLKTDFASLTNKNNKLSRQEMEKFRQIVDNYDILRSSVPNFIDVTMR